MSDLSPTGIMLQKVREEIEAPLRAELAEWKERHPYGEVDLDMAIEAETKDLKLRIDTLESAQIDYEVQCAAKDARIAELKDDVVTLSYTATEKATALEAANARIKEEFDKYCRNLTELAQVHKESCDAKDARIAGLDAEQALHIEAYKSMLARAERAEAHVVDLEEIVKGVHFLRKQAEAEALKAKAHIAALCDAMVYSDSYGVQGSEFQCCHACNAGGAPNVVFKHDEHCPVGKAEASAAEWWDDYKAAEEDRERAEANYGDAVKAWTEWKGVAERAEAERDAMREALERIVAKCPKLAPVCIAAVTLTALAPSPAGDKS